MFQILLIKFFNFKSKKNFDKIVIFYDAGQKKNQLLKCSAPQECFYFLIKKINKINHKNKQFLKVIFFCCKIHFELQISAFNIDFSRNDNSSIKILGIKITQEIFLVNFPKFSSLS